MDIGYNVIHYVSSDIVLPEPELEPEPESKEPEPDDPPYAGGNTTPSGAGTGCSIKRAVIATGPKGATRGGAAGKTAGTTRKAASGGARPIRGTGASGNPKGLNGEKGLLSSELSGATPSRLKLPTKIHMRN